MKTLVSIGLGALVVLGATAGSASAQRWGCAGGVSGWARAPNGLNYEPPRTYDMTSLAKSRAIQMWKVRVRTNCPEHSTFWWRALDKRVSCEGYAGGAVCRVVARPAHKIF